MPSRIIISGWIILCLIRSVPANGKEDRFVSISTGSDTTGDGTQTKPWGTIQHAIDVISDASVTNPYEVHVASGNYTGTATTTVILKPYIDLLGGYEPDSWSRDITSNTTVIDGGNTQSCVEMASHCKLDGFTLMRGYGGVFFPTLILSSTVSFCTITGNSGEGVKCSQNSSLSLNNCTITNNSVGLYSEGSITTLNHCTISSNAFIGIFSIESTNTINKCTIVGNSGGVYFHASYSTLTNSILWNMGREIYKELGSLSANYNCIQGGFCGIGNICDDPLFVNIVNGHYELQNGSPCINSGTQTVVPYNGTAPDIGAWESPIGYTQGLPREPILYFVNSEVPMGGDGRSWQTALKRISDRSWAGIQGDEIWVARGTYNEKIFISQGIYIYGGFSGIETERAQRDWIENVTVINGTELTGSVVTISSDERTTIDGFKITEGSTQDGGGGIHYKDVTYATLENCIITKNHAYPPYTVGGGIYCDKSSPTINNCTFTFNSSIDAGVGSGGGMYCFDSSPILSNCVFDFNTAMSGGGVYCLGGSPKFNNCTFSKNSFLSFHGLGGFGGGFSCYNSFPILINCIVSYNYATIGSGISCSHSFPEFINCIITDNCSISVSYYNHWTEGRGGGINSSNSFIKFTNCTITNNWSSDPNHNRTGGLEISNSTPTFTNCILWHNENEATMGDANSNPTVTYSCIEGGYTGIGNIQQEPLFLDPFHDDYHLQEGSPCRRKGIGPALDPNVPHTDIDGEPRSGDTCDMGADEYSQRPFVTPTKTASVTPTALLTPTQTENTVFSYDRNQDGFIDALDLLQCMKDYFTDAQHIIEFSIYWYTVITPTPTFSATHLPIWTPTTTETETAMATKTPTPTLTDTPTETFSLTSTNTEIFTLSPTETRTDTAINTATATHTETETMTPTNTETLTPTNTDTTTPSYTASLTETETETPSSTETKTFTVTATDTQTETPFAPTRTLTETATTTFSSTMTETNTKTGTSTDTPTLTTTGTRPPTEPPPTATRTPVFACVQAARIDLVCAGQTSMSATPFKIKFVPRVTTNVCGVITNTEQPLAMVYVDPASVADTDPWNETKFNKGFHCDVALKILCEDISVQLNSQGFVAETSLPGSVYLESAVPFSCFLCTDEAGLPCESPDVWPLNVCGLGNLGDSINGNETRFTNDDLSELTSGLGIICIMEECPTPTPTYTRLPTWSPNPNNQTITIDLPGLPEGASPLRLLTFSKLKTG